MEQNYLYVNSNDTGKDWAVIVLPEIYGIHPFIKKTVDDFATQFGVVVVALDHLYAGTGKSRVYDYKTEAGLGMEAMNKVTGENFLELFNQTVKQVVQKHPKTKRIVVCGFCFGGRSALLSGVNPKVSKIISYYGGGPHAEFYKSMGSVEALAKERTNSNLEVLAFYGEQDLLIPVQDREKTKQLLTSANIKYSENVLEAGHAFANFERDHYNAGAAKNAWAKVTDFLT